MAVLASYSCRWNVIRSNRISGDDDPALLLHLTQRPYRYPAFPRQCLESKGELRGIVRETVSRLDTIVRKAAGVNHQQAIVANTDAAWFVCGLDRNQGIRSLPRYQALTRLDGISVTVVLDKLDTSGPRVTVTDTADVSRPKPSTN